MSKATYPKGAFPPGSPRLCGGVPLVEAPLTVEDWRIIHHAYVGFMTVVRRVAADAYARQTAGPAPEPSEGGEGGCSTR